MTTTTKDSNASIREAAQAGKMVQLTHSEMNDFLRGGKTVEELKQEIASADQELTIEDMFSIVAIMADEKIGWAKAQKAYFSKRDGATRQYPMSDYIRMMAGKSTNKTEGE